MPLPAAGVPRNRCVSCRVWPESDSAQRRPLVMLRPMDQDQRVGAVRAYRSSPTCMRALIPWRSACARSLAWAFILWAAAASVAHADGGGDMGQGEAAIAVRSDVKLSVKGTGGTPSDRLAKLGQAVSEQMGDIRACYRKLVASAPEVTGTLRLRIGLEKDKKPALEVLDKSDGAEPLIKCVTQVLSTAKYTDVGRPAAAFLSLAFENSRARGQAQMAERSAQIAEVKVQMDASGAREAAWSTDGNEVRFTVQADRDAPPRAVELLVQGLKRGYAAFLDCRRRCEQGGVSPEGDIPTELALDAAGHLKISFGAISVRHARAPGCAEHAFKRVPFDKPGAPLRAHINVHFAP